ncbi:alkaline phosphatase [Luteipulveratus sp. YIM 133132]|uniref:alkaline phosphatase n=1 Tax=Luteipulveratus flavus TaxID=3031728 RepID=UPI0023B191C4|nr:alkaline phosphatase [Luteipulveratus sp. YIM 133132]MDE9364832.1 alkaline phosphatase [Luteipulveratus sp. YIM 133132]
MSTARLRRRTTLVAVAAAGTLVLVGGYAVAGTGSDLSRPGGAARLHGDQTQAVKKAVKGGHARNVILLIGDGMGDSEITSARNYSVGADGRLPGIDAMPLTGQYTTFSLTKDGKPDYVTDSAASGTGWSTGTKSYDGAIAVDIKGAPHATLLELAKKNGLRTGNVTTAEIEDATPAVQAAHVTSRSCYGPAVTLKTCPTNALENGGRGSIAEQLIDTRADVTLGGGAKTFAEKATAGRYQGLTLRDQAQARGYQLPTTAAELDAVRSADQKRPVLGLFADGNFPVDWSGPAATKDGATKPAARCTPNADQPATQPALKAMTTKAISLLDNAKVSRKGFFLQVEGASIDKQDHAANACGQIGETVGFDAAVKAALDFAKKDGNTTVIVTADHGHTSQIVEPGVNTPGLTTTLLTNEGSPMTLSYGTAPEGGSQEHTGTQVRIGAYGPRAANVVGLTDQTDLHYTIKDALNLR